MPRVSASRRPRDERFRLEPIHACAAKLKRTCCGEQDRVSLSRSRRAVGWHGPPGGREAFRPRDACTSGPTMCWASIWPGSASKGRPKNSTPPSSASRPCSSPVWPLSNCCARNAPDVVLSCEATAGLSLGEYTALVFAGAIEFEDGLRLVQVRGEAMQEAADAAPSGMVSVLGLDRRRSRSFVGKPARETSYRSPTCFAPEISWFPAPMRRANAWRKWRRRPVR